MYQPEQPTLRNLSQLVYRLLLVLAVLAGLLIAVIVLLAVLLNKSVGLSSEVDGLSALVNTCGCLPTPVPTTAAPGPPPATTPVV